MYRVFYLFNWIYRYAVGSPPETVAVIAGIVQSVLYGDFFYIYYQRYERSYVYRVFRGISFKLPR